MNRCLLSLAVLLALGTVAVAPAIAQVSAVPSAINFQGRLATPSGNPVPDGAYSVRFSLHDAVTGGTEKYSKTVANVAVKNGTFAVTLDAFLANTFNGNLWLEVKIGNDAALSPRTPLVSVPYAMKSDLALTVPDGSLTLSKFVPSELNFNVWLMNGNNNAVGKFLGTNDNTPMEFRAFGHRAMRYQYMQNTTDSAPINHYRGINILGGSEINSTGIGIIGATIAGGGLDYFNTTDAPNGVFADFGTIGGGYGNTVVGRESTIAGGIGNTTNGNNSSIGGGFVNTTDALWSAIGGGYMNYTGGLSSTVPGGFRNTANSDYSTVAGGIRNTASSTAATVAGGSDNTAGGAYSFAAGYRAKANSTGAFVWSDSTAADFATTGANQFLIRANGGVGINTNNPGTAKLRVYNTSSQIGICAGDLAPVGAASFESHRVTNTSTYHFACTNSGTDVFYVDGSGRPHGTGSYAQISDARFKHNVVPIDNALDAILNLRGVTFDWDTEKWKERGLPTGKQIGFIAQEVEKVLPELVTTDKNGYKMVSYADAVPVLVEAVKTLSTKVKQKDAKIAELESRLDTLAASVAKLQNKAK